MENSFRRLWFVSTLTINFLNKVNAQTEPSISLTRFYVDGWKVRCRAETFQIKRRGDFMSKKSKHKKHYKKTDTRKLREKAYECFSSQYTNNLTQKSFIRNYDRFITFCRENYKSKTVDDCKKHIDEYINYLVGKGLSANTIHTYLAPVVIYHNMSLDDVSVPKRYSAHNTRSRKERADYRSNANPYNPKYSYSVEFQRRVGIRRNELLHLKKNDCGYDDSDCFCVIVRKGKGGKTQWQRVLPEDEVFVKEYFDNTEDFVFSREEMKNKIDYHAIRAQQAKRAYDYYLQKLNSDPDYRQTLTNEIYKRWNKFCKTKDGKGKHLDKGEITGTYFIRGENKKLAIKKGLPLKYDKLALMAVSIFHLSHWRNDVTVSNYLLA